MTKKIQKYKKLMTRFYPNIYYECWYQGERFELYKFSNKKVFFEPLFVYEKNQGTSVYYNFTDPQQQSFALVEYFDKKLGLLIKLINIFKSNYETLIKVCSNKKITSFDKLEKIYSLHLELMPVVTTTVILGNFDKEIKNRKVAKLNLETRITADNLVLCVINGMLGAMREIVPKKYEKYLYFLTFEEVMSNKLPSISILKERQNGYIYYKNSIVLGEDLNIFCKKNKIKIINDKVENIKNNIIKGNPAFAGKLTGRVKIISDISDMKKIKKDEILVTSMTTPDLIAVSKNFAAIITDEGGITCHAAIVARELKITCIVGTKIATKILKDGDLVEVDANKGFIKILK